MSLTRQIATTFVDSGHVTCRARLDGMPTVHCRLSNGDVVRVGVRRLDAAERAYLAASLRRIKARRDTTGLGAEVAARRLERTNAVIDAAMRWLVDIGLDVPEQFNDDRRELFVQMATSGDALERVLVAVCQANNVRP